MFTVLIGFGIIAKKQKLSQRREMRILRTFSILGQPKLKGDNHLTKPVFVRHTNLMLLIVIAVPKWSPI